MVMWPCDKTGDILKEYQNFREEARRLEKEYLEIRVLVRDAEAALHADPENEEFKAQLEHLRKRQGELERLAPRFSSDVPLQLVLRSSGKMV